MNYTELNRGLSEFSKTGYLVDLNSRDDVLFFTYNFLCVNDLETLIENLTLPFDHLSLISMYTRSVRDEFDNKS